MKAVTFSRYGMPDVLRLQEIETPSPGENEVLIRIHASSVNDWDWGLLRGQPFVNRMLFGLRKPGLRILGLDVAGEVVSVGSKANRFNPGDRVFGDLSGCGFGGYAEYVSAPETALSVIPESMTFEQAAAIPQAGLLALQGLISGITGKSEIRADRQSLMGKKVLINGAGGGTGSFAIQIARAFGAEVTGVDRTSKLELMRSLGAVRVVDFTREDFTRTGKHYDLILDVSAHHSILRCRHTLKPGGRYVMVGGTAPRIFEGILVGPLISMGKSRKMGILAHKPNQKIELLMDLFEDGEIKPVIDRIFPLEEVADALRYFGQGNVRGKIIILVTPPKGNHVSGFLPPF